MKNNKSKLSFDGTNLLMRIPLDVQSKLGLKKGDVFEWLIQGRNVRLEIIKGEPTAVRDQSEASNSKARGKKK